MTVEEIKNNYKPYLKKAKRDILEILKKGPAQRKDIIDTAVTLSGMTEAELKNRAAGGSLALYRSLVGSALSDMQKYGDISVSESGAVTLKKKPAVIIGEAEIAPYIINLLQSRALNAEEITEKATVYFGAAETLTLEDDAAIKRTVARLLPSLVKRGKISYMGGRYSLGSGMILVKKPSSVFEEFISYLNSKGGEFFENYSAMLLERYFISCGKLVGACNVIGGSDDGGIDVMLTVADWLGFEDTVLVQCKQKSNSNVTLNEVKQFVGAFYVEKGTKGIYMTTSRFHRDATTVINGLRDIVAIDGRKLFDIAKKCSCGIVEKDGQYAVDYGFFGAR